MVVCIYTCVCVHKVDVQFTYYTYVRGAKVGCLNYEVGSVTSDERGTFEERVLARGAVGRLMCVELGLWAANAPGFVCSFSGSLLRELLVQAGR
jgi:hypothetical protein